MNEALGDQRAPVVHVLDLLRGDVLSLRQLEDVLLPAKQSTRKMGSLTEDVLPAGGEQKKNGFTLVTKCRCASSCMAREGKDCVHLDRSMKVKTDLRNITPDANRPRGQSGPGLSGRMKILEKGQQRLQSRS
jgi:hypothetical protein